MLSHYKDLKQLSEKDINALIMNYTTGEYDRCLNCMRRLSGGCRCFTGCSEYCLTNPENRCMQCLINDNDPRYFDEDDIEQLERENIHFNGVYFHTTEIDTLSIKVVACLRFLKYEAVNRENERKIEIMECLESQKLSKEGVVF